MVFTSTAFTFKFKCVGLLTCGGLLNWLLGVGSTKNAKTNVRKDIEGVSVLLLDALKQLFKALHSIKNSIARHYSYNYLLRNNI